MKLQSLFFASTAFAALSSPFSFVSAQSSSSSDDFASGSQFNPDGPVGSCAYAPVYLNDFTLTLTPDSSSSSSSTAIDILPDFTPSYNGQGPNWRYVVERGDDLPTGTITFTPTNLTDFSTFRIRFNHGDYVYLQEGESTTSPLLAGTDFIEYDVIQAPCAGTDIQEYSITLYQNGTSIIPPPVVTPPVVIPPVDTSTGAAVVVTPPPTTTPPSQGGDSNTPPPPTTTPPTETASTGAAESTTTPPTTTTTCPYTPVYLNQFSLFLTPSGSNSQIDFLPYITPIYSPSGPEWFYVIERGESLVSGSISFTPLDFTSGSTFRIRFNHGDYTYLNAGQSITADLIAGTDLIEWDVIQAPCAGTDIQEYSITLYQNGTDKAPSNTITPPPSSGGDTVTPLPPPSVIPPVVIPPVVTPPVTTPPMSGADMSGMNAPKVACQAITYSQAAIANGAASVIIEFNNTDTARTVDWVDFHVSINAPLVAGTASVEAPQFNYRMKAGADANSFLLSFPSSDDDVTLLANSDYINYFFTYCSETTDCNTEVFNYAPHPSASAPSSGAADSTPSAPTTSGSGSMMTPPVGATCPHTNFSQYTSVGADAAGNETFSFSWYSTTPGVVTQWVDIHVTIQSSTVNGQFNYRMFESTIPADQQAQFTGFVPTQLFFLTMPGADGVTIPQDATVSYSFTYCSDFLDCNSPSYNFFRNPQQGGDVVGSGSAASGACPAVTYVPSFERDAANPNILTVNFTVTSNQMVQWVDLHVTINTALLSDGKGAYSPSFNYRMTQVSSSVFSYTFPGIDGVSVPSTSYLDYFFTYCSMVDEVQTDCNTEPGTFGASEAIGLVVTENKLDISRNNGTSSSPITITSNPNSNSNQNSAMTKSVGSAFVITAAAVIAALVL